MNTPSLVIGILPEQAMRVLPHQVIFAGLLELSGYELRDAIEHELAENPALVGDSPGLPTVPLLAASAGPMAADGLPAAKETPVAALLADVAADLPSADRWLAEYLLADLDERGLLGRSVETLASELRVPIERMIRVLAAVRRAGPPGIAAIDVRECLRLQLAVLPTRGVAVPPHLHAVLEQPWELVAEPARCAVATGISRAAVEQALDFLRQHCRPYAFLSDGTATPAAISAPDLVVIEDADGELDVVAADPGSSLRIDRRYLDAVRGEQLPRAQAAELHAQVSRARAFIAHLQQRTGTVVTVARAAVRRQAAFVRQGPRAHTPLTRTELAAELGLSEPTVSRAVSRKSLRLPDGRVIALAALFGTSVSVREALRELLRGDPPARSDGELAALLSAAGFRIARRTVAKYRCQIGAPASSRRPDVEGRSRLRLPEISFAGPA
jgi:RNA polymerase sigma-54 factor